MNMWASVLWEDVLHPSLYSLLGLKDLTNLKLEEGHLWKGSGCCSCLHLWTSPPVMWSPRLSQMFTFSLLIVVPIH